MTDEEAGWKANEIVKQETLALMEESGISFSFLLDKLKAEMEAEEMVFAKFEGQITDARNVIDWGTRQRARMDAHKLRGDYPAEKQEITVKGSLADKLKEARERAKGIKNG